MQITWNLVCIEVEEPVNLFFKCIFTCQWWICTFLLEHDHQFCENVCSLLSSFWGTSCIKNMWSWDKLQYIWKKQSCEVLVAKLKILFDFASDSQSSCCNLLKLWISYQQHNFSMSKSIDLIFCQIYKRFGESKELNYITLYELLNFKVFISWS